MLGLGLVLKYRSAGVVDFAHGAVAMFCAYVYIELHSNGELQFPWIVIPHQIKVASSNGLATVPVDRRSPSSTRRSSGSSST